MNNYKTKKPTYWVIVRAANGCPYLTGKAWMKPGDEIILKIGKVSKYEANIIAIQNKFY